MTKAISIVIPCCNEGGNILKFIDRINLLIERYSGYEFELIFVNDGSVDETFSLLRQCCKNSPLIRAIDLTRNFGKEAALTAGLDYASGDAIVFIDADLQHPPEIVGEFIDRWEAGNKVVVGRRMSRHTDSFIYRYLADFFYRLHNKISDIKLPENVGDFRLIDRQVANQLKRLGENRRFMKGLFAWVGYDPVYIDYEVGKRLEGISSFSKWKSWNFAMEGITSFSTVPLRLWTYLGGIICGVGVAYSVVIITRTLFYGIQTPGYVTLLTALIVFGGIQLIGLGVIGEYIGRIYLEVKNRPSYLVKELVNSKVNE